MLRQHIKLFFHSQQLLFFICSDVRPFSAIFSKLSFWWDNKHLETFFIPNNFYYWYVVILGHCQQLSESWDFTETTFWIFFDPQLLLLLICSDFRPFSAIFTKLRFCWDNKFKHFLFPDNFYFCNIVIFSCSQQFSASWDCTVTKKCNIFSLPATFINEIIND